jgi:replication factor A1
MKINEIKRGMSSITVEGEIVDKSETRRVRTRYGPRSVADVTLQDETASIKLSLWEERIDTVNTGDTVKVSSAYVTEFRNELQLNIPRSGKLEIIKQNVIEI